MIFCTITYISLNYIFYTKVKTALIHSSWVIIIWVMQLWIPTFSYRSSVASWAPLVNTDPLLYIVSIIQIPRVFLIFTKKILTHQVGIIIWWTSSQPLIKISLMLKTIMQNIRSFTLISLHMLPQHTYGETDYIETIPLFEKKQWIWLVLCVLYGIGTVTWYREAVTSAHITSRVKQKA